MVSTARTSIPPIDWAAEAEHVAGDIVAKQVAKESLRAFGTHPKGMDLPRGPPTHRLGVTERFAGGEVITWINEKCYYTNRPPFSASVGPYQVHKPIDKVCKS